MSTYLKSFQIDKEKECIAELYDSFKPMNFHSLIPFMGIRPVCGLFGVSDDFIESYQSLDERFMKNKTSTFLFQAEGDSMEPFIFKGDILLVDRSIENYHGRICIVTYEGGLICKRVYKMKKGVILRSENTSYKDILVNSNELVSIWGVVTSRHGDTH